MPLARRQLAFGVTVALDAAHRTNKCFNVWSNLQTINIGAAASFAGSGAPSRNRTGSSLFNFT